MRSSGRGPLLPALYLVHAWREERQDQALTLGEACPHRSCGITHLRAVAHQAGEQLDVGRLELTDLEQVAELRAGVDVAGTHAVGDQHRVIEAQPGSG